MISSSQLPPPPSYTQFLTFKLSQSCFLMFSPFTHSSSLWFCSLDPLFFFLYLFITECLLIYVGCRQQANPHIWTSARAHTHNGRARVHKCTAEFTSTAIKRHTDLLASTIHTHTHTYTHTSEPHQHTVHTSSFIAMTMKNNIPTLSPL